MEISLTHRLVGRQLCPNSFTVREGAIPEIWIPRCPEGDLTTLPPTHGTFCAKRSKPRCKKLSMVIVDVGSDVSRGNVRHSWVHKPFKRGFCPRTSRGWKELTMALEINRLATDLPLAELTLISQSACWERVLQFLTKVQSRLNDVMSANTQNMVNQ
jgi:hypothetical protein